MRYLTIKVEKYHMMTLYLYCSTPYDFDCTCLIEKETLGKLSYKKVTSIVHKKTAKFLENNILYFLRIFFIFTLCLYNIWYFLFFFILIYRSHSARTQKYNIKKWSSNTNIFIIIMTHVSNKKLC